MDETVVAACPRTESFTDLEDKVAYVEEAAPLVEAAVARAARQLLAEHDAGAVSSAALAELEKALRELRAFEDVFEVTLG